MKLVSGKCLWKPRKLRRLRFFTKTIQLPWLWATGRVYIDRFICLSSGSVECWPCGRVVPSSTDIVQSDIVSAMKWDMTTYHLPSPLPRGHTTPHTAQPGTLWEIRINSENVNGDTYSIKPLISTHIDIDWQFQWKKSMFSVWSSHKSPWSPHTSASVWEDGNQNTHQFHCF